MFPRDKKVLKEDIKIHHTMRIMPQDQNTGGFFVALLKKHDHINFSKSEASKVDENTEEGHSSTKIKTNDGTNITPKPETTSIEDPTHLEKPVTIKIEKIEKKKRNGYAVPKLDYVPFTDKYMEAWIAIRDMYGFDEVDSAH